MPRQSRRLSSTGMYHIMFRGINKQDIFHNHHDYQKMKSILLKVKAEMSFEIYAYCLMKNHVHLFIKENECGQVSKIMTKILSNYAGWYNRKYERTGHLFESRYKSEAVEDESYYMALIRYIHQNPIKAGIVKSPDEYWYSSYNEYIFEPILADTYMMFEMLSGDDDFKLREFVELHEAEEIFNFEISGTSYTNNVRYVKHLLKTEYGISDTDAMTKSERNNIIFRLNKIHKISHASIAEAFDITRSTVSKIIKQKFTI